MILSSVGSIDSVNPTCRANDHHSPQRASLGRGSAVVVVGVVVVVVVSTTAGTVDCGALLLLGLGANSSDTDIMHIAVILVGVCTDSLLTA